MTTSLAHFIVDPSRRDHMGAAWQVATFRWAHNAVAFLEASPTHYLIVSRPALAREIALARD